MYDLVGSYWRLKRIYRGYIESAFPMRFDVLNQERARLLDDERAKHLTQAPLLEPMPIYPSSELTLTDVADRLGVEYAGFAELARDLVPPGVTLYDHQWRSLQAALSGRDVVVTTGTGSGKTECFLLPLFAELAHEMRDWPGLGEPAPEREWWREADDSRRQEGEKKRRKTPKREVGQFAHSRRPHALRAVILYPLNALVEDQLRRLRKALENADTTRWLDRNRGANRVLFGRYTGATPVPGRQGDAAATQRLASELRKLYDREEAILRKLDRAVADEREQLEDLRYFFPSMWGGEMWSRWDMQESPPDILITNYSMLNIMLNREVEEPIFDRTKTWLNEDSRRFYLIVDELHAYRGTQGTEVGYVLRLLLHRIGLAPESPQLRILTTSASIEDDEKSRRFLAEFFGRSGSRFEVISSSQVAPRDGARAEITQHAAAFRTFADEVEQASREVLGEDAPWQPPVVDAGHIGRAMTKLALELADVDTRRIGREQVVLGTALQRIRVEEALRDAVRSASGKGEVRPVSLDGLDAILFPDETDKWRPSPFSKALRGLLLALAVSQRSERDDRSPAPVRGHLFFHNHQNLWACSNPHCDNSKCNRGERRDNGAELLIGALHATHQLTCSCGGRVLDLVICEACGEIFLGGHSSPGPASGTEILTADSGLNELTSELPTQTVKTYRLFWPSGSENDAPRLPQNATYTRSQLTHRWTQVKLNAFAGLLSTSLVEESSVVGWTYRVIGKGAEAAPAMPPKCPNCDADFGGRDRNPTPLRNHRTAFQKSCQVLATALAREIPLHGEKRKLVLFSDSRQDAAKLAAGVENDHYRDLLRIAMLEAPGAFWKPFVALLHVLSRKAPELLDKVEINPSLRADAASGTFLGERINGAQRLAQQLSVDDVALAAALQSWALEMPAADQDVEKRLHQLITSYPGSLPLLAVRNTVRRRLLANGVHPGGIAYWLQTFRDDSDVRRPWYDLLDWPEAPEQVPKSKSPLPSDGQAWFGRIDRAVLAELMYALFPHRARTIEGLGQALVSCENSASLASKVREAVDVAIRMMGERRKHLLQGYTSTNRAWSDDGDERKLPGYVGKYLEAIGDVTSTVVRRVLEEFQTIVGGRSSCQLDPARLTLRVAELDENARVVGWRCKRCRTFYLHHANGCCHNCRGDLELAERPEIFDYYVYLSDHSGGAFRFNVAELTGQTDRDQRLDRQCRFQDIFLRDEPERPTGIDMLSVTTTMEAGVDIGGLLAVMLANMPPRRFNYQQRVGRAGRRGSGVSLALTFCRGRSHDDFYYQRPMEITGDPPPSPYVDVGRESIIRRAINKEILRLAFCDAPRDPDASRGGDSVHGEFGRADDWHQVTGRRQHVIDWLLSPHNESQIRRIINALIVGTLFSEDGAFATEQVSYLRSTLPELIDRVVGEKRYTQDALSERLANAGALPMFGFPTRVRLLFTQPPRGGRNWPPERNVIDRNLDIALSQFAPGSETVKDKAIHTSVGVVRYRPSGPDVVAEDGFAPPLSGGNPVLIGVCSSCEAVIDGAGELAKPRDGGMEPPLSDCPVCRAQRLRLLDAREPRGFVTDFSPRDYDASVEYVPRATRPRLGVAPPPADAPEIANLRLWAAEQDIISLNDNGGVGGFDFGWIPLGRPDAGRGWVAPEVLDDDQRRNRHTDTVPTYRVALLSRRRTDVLVADLVEWPDGVAASPETHEGKAAWFSFAFYLRLAAAALLDVDTNELEAGIRTGERDSSPIGQAFLSDTLDNGAGYARWLAEGSNFRRLLDQAAAGTPGTIAAYWSAGTGGALEPHGRMCDTSCNRCLRDHGNIMYHPWLDWRLALDMARLAASSKAPLDLTSVIDGRPNPWHPLVDPYEGPIAKLVQELHWRHEGIVQGLNIYRFEHDAVWAIERHPLWTNDHPLFRRAVRELAVHAAGSQLRVINPFRLLRQPTSLFDSTTNLQLSPA